MTGIDSGTPRTIFTVPVGAPFLDSLARAILAGHLPRAGGAAPSPIELSRYTLLLPTRRTTRALQEAFLRAAGGAAMLLPRIRPIGQGQEDLDLIAGMAGLVSLGTDHEGLPPAIGDIERRIALTRLVQRWSQALRRGDAGTAEGTEEGMAPFAAAGARTPAQASLLAGELARLVDMLETEGVSLATVSTLVPDTFAEHWNQTLTFLRIITDYWPAYLAERGLLSRVDRQNRLLDAEAERLATLPPPGPVIVAGVVGSVPATARLMAVVAGLEQGAIVLPGLDRALDEESWRAVGTGHPEHPQYGLGKILAALAVSRDDVRDLPGIAPDSDRTARSRLISEAMRPAATTSQWHDYARTADRSAITAALTGVTLIEAPGAEDEAEIATLILREAIETPGRTAALVSPDRLLARRVAAKLRALGIAIDDSAGRPFAKTPPGAFLDLIVEVLASDFAPVALVALLKHPLTRFGLPAAEVRRAARVLEIAAFRTTYLGRGLDGVDAALDRAWRATGDGERRGRTVSRISDPQWEAARDLVGRLRQAFHTFSGAAPDLRHFARAHLDAAEALAKLPAGDPSNPLLSGEAGLALTAFFDGLTDPALPDLPLCADEYPDFYRSLVAGQNVLTRGPVHPRIAILGAFEARLQQPDVVILGSLNEASWPEAADPGPWLNRPMRRELGLSAPEEATGRSAHDFVSGLGAAQVYLTRAAKIDGVPTVPSRWLMRLQALLDGLDLRHSLQSDQPWLGWARWRDRVPPRKPILPPEPRPVLALRPRKLSVTAVETWMSNPYAIYARYILELESLDAIGAEPDAALKGSIVHEALGRFSKAHPAGLPDDTADDLMRLIRAVLADHAAHPRVAAFWLPRLERFAAWFAETEPGRRLGIERIAAEVAGSDVFDGPGGPFTLRARADRIDLSRSGLAIIDYKTGLPPTTGRVEAGGAPQLPLEAAIAIAGGFEGIAAGPVGRLAYIRVTGAEPPGAEIILKLDIAAAAAGARKGLLGLIARYDDAATPYRAVRRPMFAGSYRHDAFAHLARVAEWTAETDGEE